MGGETRERTPVEGGYLMSTRASFFTYLVLRYRGLAPSAGNSLARRRQKSEIGVASATAPRRHEFPRRKRIGARSMMFSRRLSRPRFFGFVKVAARSNFYNLQPSHRSTTT